MPQRLIEGLQRFRPEYLPMAALAGLAITTERARAERGDDGRHG